MGKLVARSTHRIMCGSSTDADSVTALLAGATPYLMVTDPPYGVNYDADWRNHSFRPDGTAMSSRAIGKVENDDRADWREAWALFPGDVAYIWHAGAHSPTVAESLHSVGFETRNLIIWAKNHMVIGRGHYHHKHEPCWYMVRKGATGHWQGDRTQTTLWDIDKPQRSETGHSTQKPLECMKKPMINNSEEGDSVYEPFSGSGTTLVAGEQCGRHVYAMEINPPYVDLAVQRFQQAFKKDAYMEGTGKKFQDVAAERGITVMPWQQ